MKSETEIVNKIRHGFYLMENEVLDKWVRVIGPGAFMVYNLLRRFCKPGEVQPFPQVRVEDWAAWLGISGVAFMKHIATLGRWDLITVSRKNARAKYTYVINPVPSLPKKARQQVTRFPANIRFGDPLWDEPMFTHKLFLGKKSLCVAPKESLSVGGFTPKESLGLYNTVEDKNTVSNKTNPISAAIEKYVRRWFTIQQANFPSRIPKVSPAQITQSVATVEALVRLDGYTLKQVIKAIMWVADKDCWWCDKVLSLASLRQCRVKGDASKFAKIFAAMEKEVGPTRSIASRPDNTPLPPQEQQAYALLTQILGEDAVRKADVLSQVAAMRRFHADLSTKFPKAVEHLKWDKFFADWLEFLREKQPTFPLRDVRQLRIGDTRWREFIQRCEHWSQYNFRTGVFQP